MAAADSMWERSGLPSRRGVGTVITATSKPAYASGSLDGRYRPERRAAATASSLMSST